MEVTTKQIKHKEMVGLFKGSSVWAIESWGGLNIIGYSDGEKFNTLSIGPNFMVAKALAEKKGATFDRELKKSQDEAVPASSMLRVEL